MLRLALLMPLEQEISAILESVDGIIMGGGGFGGGGDGVIHRTVYVRRPPLPSQTPPLLVQIHPTTLIRQQAYSLTWNTLNEHIVKLVFPVREIITTGSNQSVSRSVSSLCIL